MNVTKYAVAACALFFFQQETRADQKHDPFSVTWLEKGCLSIMVFEKDLKNWTKDQEKTANQVTFWLNGFLVGANSMFAAEGPDSVAPAIVFPPETWMDSKKLAPLILEFIRQNKQIPKDAKAREVMTAWYYISHPKATQEQKNFGIFLLSELAKGKTKQ